MADVAIEKGLKHDKMKDWINKHFRLLGCEQLTDNDPLSMKFRTIVSKLREEVQTMVCFNVNLGIWVGKVHRSKVYNSWFQG